MLSTERTSRPHHPFTNPLHLVHNHPAFNLLRGPSMTPQAQQIEHIWVITGPAGSGKTTVAQYLAAQLNVPYVEGDDYHSAANKAKMASGQPLTDADRWDWLIALREAAVKQLQTSNSVIVACSALKHKYRDVMRVANYEHPTVQIHFIYLKVDEQTLQNRVATRQGHYMKAGMVQSQMKALEEPEEDQEWDVLPVDVREDKESVQRHALQAVQKKLREYDNVPLNNTTQ